MWNQCSDDHLIQNAKSHFTRAVDQESRGESRASIRDSCITRPKQ